MVIGLCIKDFADVEKIARQRAPHLFDVESSGQNGAEHENFGVFGLVVVEPDLGTSVIIVAIALLLYFFSGAPAYQFLLLFPFQ